VSRQKLATSWRFWTIYFRNSALNLLKLGLWLRTVRTVFCNRLLETAQFWRPSWTYSLSVRTVGRLDISIGRPGIKVVGFFLSFLKTPILSQCDTRAEGYDKNAETCTESFLETWIASGWCWPSVRTVSVSQSMSKHEIQLLVEHWMASERYCHVLWMDALEHWILLELLIAAGRFAITFGRMQSW
jgi:hypothetical protein